MLTTVLDLNTGDSADYTLVPERAVVAAYAQREKRDWNTWDYYTKYAHLVTVTPSSKSGIAVVTCGNQSCLKDVNKGAHGWPLVAGARGNVSDNARQKKQPLARLQK